MNEIEDSQYKRDDIDIRSILSHQIREFLHRESRPEDYEFEVTSLTPTPEEGVEIFKQLQPLLAKHGFELKKWICNNEQIQNVIPEELLSKSSTKRIEVDPTVEDPSVLGLQ